MLYFSLKKFFLLKKEKNLNSAGSFADVFVDIFPSVLNLSTGISIIFVVIFPL